MWDEYLGGSECVSHGHVILSACHKRGGGREGERERERLCSGEGEQGQKVSCKVKFIP